MNGLAKICPKCGLRYDAAAQFCTKDGSTLKLTEEDHDPRIGQVLLDQFRIEEAIGAGGMGAVYRARQTTLGRDVAIKILHPDMATNQDAVRRFHREARISTALDHPNVVRVFLFGQLPDGSLYLVMELLRGRTLAELLRVEPQLPVARALHIATQVAAGVGEAHAQGVVHRDVKPENVFLVSKGKDPDFVKVLDFGIARLFRNEDQTQATQSGLVFGTARYISPEGAAGEKTDARSDVYSLGVLAYQLLSGETPFPPSAPVTLLMQHIHDRPPHLKSRAAGREVPDGIADVVMRSLAKNPDGRYEDASDFAEALRDAAMRAGIEFRPRGQASGAFSSSSMERERRDPSMPIRGEAPPRRDPSGRREAEIDTPMRASAMPTTEELAAVGRGKRDTGGLGRFGAVAFAFVVGAILVAGGAFGLDAYATSRADAAHTETIHLAEAALGAERWEGDGSVRMLTDRLLAERPADPDALRIRHAAADELVEDARAALTRGERDEAERQVELARTLVPDHHGAEALGAELARPVTPPRTAAVTVTPAPVSGERVELRAVVADGIEVGLRDRPRFVIRRDGVRVSRHVDATATSEPGTFAASFTFPSAGGFTVEFVVGDGPEGYRIASDVHVDRGTRPRVEEDPPITTTGSVGGSPFTPVPAVVDVPPPPPFTTATPPTTVAAAPPPPDEHPAPPALPPAWTSGN